MSVWADPEGRGSGTPGKSKMAIGFLRNFGMDHPREAKGSNFFSKVVRNSVEYVNFLDPCMECVYGMKLDLYGDASL